MCQTDRRPLTTLATFSSCMHSEKFDSNLCDATDYCPTAAGSVMQPYSFVSCCAGNESSVFSQSPTTVHMQPVASLAERDASGQNLAFRSEKIDDVSSKVPIESWLDTTTTYNAADYRTVCDTEYCQAVDSSVTLYTNSARPDATRGAYQASGYQSADWTAAYQSVPSGYSTCNAAEDDDAEDHASCSQLSAAISSDQLPDSDQSSDEWSSGVSAKKIKQVRHLHTEHGRRATESALRRASTGSLLCTTSPDSVSS